MAAEDDNGGDTEEATSEPAVQLCSSDLIDVAQSASLVAWIEPG